MLAGAITQALFVTCAPARWCVIFSPASTASLSPSADARAVQNSSFASVADAIAPSAAPSRPKHSRRGHAVQPWTSQRSTRRDRRRHLDDDIGRSEEQSERRETYKRHSRLSALEELIKSECPDERPGNVHGRPSGFQHRRIFDSQDSAGRDVGRIVCHAWREGIDAGRSPTEIMLEEELYRQSPPVFVPSPTGHRCAGCGEPTGAEHLRLR